MNNDHDTSATLARLQTHLPELLQYYVVDTDQLPAPAQEDTACSQ